MVGGADGNIDKDGSIDGDVVGIVLGVSVGEELGKSLGWELGICVGFCELKSCSGENSASKMEHKLEWHLAGYLAMQCTLSPSKILDPR